MKGFYHSVYTFFNGLQLDEPEIQPRWFDFLIYSSARSQLPGWAQQKTKLTLPLPHSSPPLSAVFFCFIALMWSSCLHAYCYLAALCAMSTVDTIMFIATKSWWGFFCMCVCTCVWRRQTERVNRAKATRAVGLYRPPCEASFLHHILVCIHLSPLYVSYYVLFVDVM